MSIKFDWGWPNSSFNNQVVSVRIPFFEMKVYILCFLVLVAVTYASAFFGSSEEPKGYMDAAKEKAETTLLAAKCAKLFGGAAVSVDT